MQTFFLLATILLSISAAVIPCAFPDLSPGTYIISSKDPQFKDLSTEISFSDNRMSFTQCNSHSCNYSQDHQKFELGLCMSTRMFCQNFDEPDLLSVFSKTDRIRVKGRFYVFYSSTDKSVSLRLKKVKQAQPTEPTEVPNLAPGTYILDSTNLLLKDLSTQFRFDNGSLGFKECNIYSCSYKQNSQDFQLIRCLSTLMFCQGSHQRDITSILNQADRVRANGNIFELYSSEDESVALRLRKVTEDPVTTFPPGTYVIDSTNPQFKDLKTELVFSAEGLSFKQCNLYNCKWSQNGENFTIEECFGTQMYCEGSKEHVLLDFFNSVVEWSQQGDKYTLIGSDPSKKLTLRKTQ